MTCSQPGASTPEELMACADGNADPAVMRHVAVCVDCAAEVAAYARAQSRLRHAFYRLTCPPTEVFGDYELGLLPEADRVAVASHTLECPRCAEELHVLREFLAPLAEPSPPQRGVVEGLRRIFATAFASPYQAGFELRGPRDTTSRSYRGGSLTIEISQAPEARLGKYAISGLVWNTADPEADVAGQAELVAPNGAMYESTVDVSRAFAFDDVAQGSYQLMVRLPAELVIVEDLRVGN